MWGALADRGLRVLNTAAPGSNLVAAQRLRLLPGKGKQLGDACLIAGGQTVVATVFSVKAATGSPAAGGAIVEFSARTGRIVRTLRTQPHGGNLNVVAVDPSVSAQHFLAATPGFGRFDNGKFTSLPPPSPDKLAVAWQPGVAQPAAGAGTSPAAASWAAIRPGTSGDQRTKAKPGARRVRSAGSLRPHPGEIPRQPARGRRRGNIPGTSQANGPDETGDSETADPAATEGESGDRYGGTRPR